MGYELAITRAPSLSERGDFPITETEWRSIADVDGELALSSADYYERKIPSGGIQRLHPWLYVAHQSRPPLWLVDGAIETKNPDVETIQKMVRLAKSLNAEVVGEEGERYGEDGTPIVGNAQVPQKQSWLSRIFRQ